LILHFKENFRGIWEGLEVEKNCELGDRCGLYNE
jgi:hypothetical protein